MGWLSGREMEQRSTGKGWRRIQPQYVPDNYYCSKCYHEAYKDTDGKYQYFTFCPFCGKNMQGKEDDD